MSIQKKALEDSIETKVGSLSSENEAAIKEIGSDISSLQNYDLMLENLLNSSTISYKDI